MEIRDQLSSHKVAIVIWLGLWFVIVGLIAYSRVALEAIPPTDVSLGPAGPPETFPEFVPAEATPLPRDEHETATPPLSFTPPAEEEAALSTIRARRAARTWPPATSPPTRIVAPSIGVDSPVVPVGWQAEDSPEGPGTVWKVASDAVGWHKDSAYPGNRGNVVLSGHNNIAGEVFRYLIDAEKGDGIDLYVGHTVYSYAVAGKMLLEEKGMPIEVRRQNAQWIAPTDHERLTLVSCWPYSTYTHRVIVIAVPAR